MSRLFIICLFLIYSKFANGQQPSSEEPVSLSAFTTRFIDSLKFRGSDTILHFTSFKKVLLKSRLSQYQKPSTNCVKYILFSTNGSFKMVAFTDAEVRRGNKVDEFFLASNPINIPRSAIIDSIFTILSSQQNSNSLEPIYHRKINGYDTFWSVDNPRTGLVENQIETIINDKVQHFGFYDSLYRYVDSSNQQEDANYDYNRKLPVYCAKKFLTLLFDVNKLAFRYKTIWSKSYPAHNVISQPSFDGETPTSEMDKKFNFFRDSLLANTNDTLIIVSWSNYLIFTQQTILHKSANKIFRTDFSDQEFFTENVENRIRSSTYEYSDTVVLPAVMKFLPHVTQDPIAPPIAAHNNNAGNHAYRLIYSTHTPGFTINIVSKKSSVSFFYNLAGELYQKIEAFTDVNQPYNEHLSSYRLGKALRRIYDGN